MNVAVVTGAGRGLGAALAELLARDGYDIAAHYHASAAGVEETCARVRGCGRRAVAIRADLTRDAEARELAAAVTAQFGRLDALVNNAGVYLEREGLALSEQEWYTGLNSTVSQTFFTTRAFLPLLRLAHGRVVNLGDSFADRLSARKLAWSYHIGKAGVLMLTRSLAAAEAPNGVAVNMISPGVMGNSIGESKAQPMPAGRLGTFEDIFAAVRFLLREAPPYLTGSNLIVSGGYNL
jgi:3-oxoacyl-[acyl-carrier protein] reductase